MQTTHCVKYLINDYAGKWLVLFSHPVILQLFILPDLLPSVITTTGGSVTKAVNALTRGRTL
jgi:hypothetical protein